MAEKNDPLVVLFGSIARVKLLRFFLFNPGGAFSFEDVAKRAKLVRRTARTELNALERAGVIYRKQIFETGTNGRKRRIAGYTLNANFPLLAPLRQFFFATAPINHKTILKYLRKAGTYDFVAAAGAFAGDFDRRIDILIVSKRAPAGKVEQAIRALEAELGIEVKYAFLNTDEFIYRVGMRDKLVRDVFDYQHEVLVDKLALEDGITG